MHTQAHRLEFAGKKLDFLLSLTTVSIWMNVALPAQAYDVTKVILSPNPENDPPAQKITKVPKSEVAEDGSQEFVEKVFLPRNDKLQRFDFEAEGKFTGRDIENRNFEKETMAVEANFVDVRTDRAGIALTVLFGGPGRTKQAITMSTFKGEVPLTAATKEGDLWKLTGNFQVGCTVDGKVIGASGSKVNRLSGAIEFPGDRSFNTIPRLECEEVSPSPAKP
ncbi:MAG: hypothetical protein IGS48_21175 [Oscillatoriales cyanobacterium C42_A2020_001]|nr:hypothetical protein [Leptolyngbyaceae cyanobacterium C42_A2020_001]